MRKVGGFFAVLFAVCLLIFIVWVIYSIWVDKNPEWINKLGWTSLFVGAISVAFINSIDEE